MSKQSFIQIYLFVWIKLAERNSLDEMFAAPATTLEWKTSKTGKTLLKVLYQHFNLEFVLSFISFWGDFYY